MYYQSIHRFNDDFLNDQISHGKAKWGKKFILAIGTIAKGIHGTEPCLSPLELSVTLQDAKQHGLEEVIIFRLEGMSEKYYNVL